MKKILFVFVVVLLFVTCDDQFLHDEYKGGEWFYLENKGAIMPVWVRGNISSDVFVIFLHGGPGGTSFDTAILPVFKQLYNEYAFVYWDQRGSYTVQGNVKPESFTVEQYVEDLQKLVFLIKHKYKNPFIFLMGHSWGGGLGTAYLLDTINQQHISGWIEINGAHNFKDGINLSIDWVKNKANEKINDRNNVNYWQNEINWYNNSSPPFTYNGFLKRHLENVDLLDGYWFNPSNIPEPFPLLTSPIPLFFFMNFNHVLNNFKFSELNFTQSMNKIVIPSMVLWGRHDGSLPVALAEEAYSNLGTADDDKYLYIFEYSAHMPFWEETDLFFEKVKGFIDKYKTKM
jgi:pimeloyl-ACP methyl ester carboxylesterase